MELLQLATLLIKQVGVLSQTKRLYCWAAVRGHPASQQTYMQSITPDAPASLQVLHEVSCPLACRSRLYKH